MACPHAPRPASSGCPHRKSAVSSASGAVAPPFWLSASVSLRAAHPPPPLGRAYRDWRFSESTFGQQNHSLIFYAKRADGGNIFQADSIREMIKVHDFTVKQLSITYEGETYKYTDVCKKFPEEKNCASSNFLELWDHNPDKVNSRFIMERVNDLDDVVPIESFAGTVRREDDKVISAKTVRVVYELNDVEGPAYEFEDAWNQAVASVSDDLIIHHFAERSFDDEVGRLVSGDIPIFAAGIMVIVIYVSLTLGPIYSPVRSRVLLGAMAVINVLLAVGAGFGLAAYLGVPFVSISSLLPLILLGVQVDGVIIMCDYLGSELPPPELEENVEEAIKHRLGESLKHTGPAILMTSLTAIAAFSVGSSTDLPSVSYFSSYAACSFVFTFLVLFTFFLALLVLDERRLQRGYLSYPFLCTVNTSFRCCQPKPLPKAAVEEGDKPMGFTQRIVANYYAPTLLKPPVAVLVTLIFVGLAVGSYLILPQMTFGQPDSDVLPDDSYVQDALRTEIDDFGGRILAVQIVIPNESYDRPNVRKAAERALRRIEDVDFVIYKLPDFTEGYKLWLFQRGLDEDGPNHDYGDRLGRFVRTKGFTQFNESIACPSLTEDACDPFAVKYDILYSKGTGDSLEILERRQVLEDILHDEELTEAFAYTQEYLFAEVDTVIIFLTLSNMGYALAAIFAITLLFTPPVVAFWITFCVALIDLDLLGAMVLTGTALNTVSFVNLVMSVGLSVDYCTPGVYCLAGPRPTDALTRAVPCLQASTLRTRSTTSTRRCGRRSATGVREPTPARRRSRRSA